MLLLRFCSRFCSRAVLALLPGPLLVGGDAVPDEPEDVTIEILHRPFICHRKTKFGDLLLVHQEGYFQNGTMFHSSRIHGNKQPGWFTLGIREAIRGFDRGLKDMCAGEKRRLVIPPALAYGKEGKGKIPPNSTLTFVIEVQEIRNGVRSHEAFQEMDLNDDWRLSRKEVKEHLRKEFELNGHPPNDTLHEEITDNIFKKEDQNKDGYLTAREFTYRRDEL
ncbi:peptidyl-prolyl cis-trans isomerase FKBP14-like [Boleophthalmus pectinirostris]|uniref:peptidyl-prolyl cis-trans isomerase FKBP14-like n=1 Tax=Boleophthalmus pectinirostris TaxID=150288 RepID=UPI002432A7B3|nr:peptidyl-prolyl cis-trans isomerase FKBP14-like [Boleophthalmus pectinirostris]